MIELLLALLLQLTLATGNPAQSNKDKADPSSNTQTNGPTTGTTGKEDKDSKVSGYGGSGTWDTRD